MAWDPKTVEKPENAILTPYPHGWCKSMGGRTRHVCGCIPYHKAKKRYEARCRAGDFDDRRVSRPVPAGKVTVSDLINLYREWLEKRLETGRPKRLKPRTFDDIRRALAVFKRAIGATRLAGDLRPADGTAFLAAIPGKSASQQANHVAYVGSMLRWGVKAEHLPHLPNLGPDFVKPSKADREAESAGKAKAWTPDEVHRMVGHARKVKDALVLAWIHLGVNCAFRADDISDMTPDVVKLDADDGPKIDYRRPKTTVFRWCPLRPETVGALKAYARPAPANDDAAGRFFLTTTGLPWTRFTMERTSAGSLVSASPVYMSAQRFKDFLDDAGVKSNDRGLGAFRHTFRHYADEVGDERAADTIMGHKSRSRAHISANYAGDQERVRLERVVNHVWAAVFTKRAQRGGGRKPSPAA